jgi:hypothetical protein
MKRNETIRMHACTREEKKIAMCEAGYLCKGHIRSWRRGGQDLAQAPQLAAGPD